MNISVYGNRLQRPKSLDRRSESSGEDHLASFVFVVKKKDVSNSACFLLDKPVISSEVYEIAIFANYRIV